MTSPLCPCGRPSTRSGDPCPLCQIKVLRSLARGCVDLASHQGLPRGKTAKRLLIEAALRGTR